MKKNYKLTSPFSSSRRNALRLYTLLLFSLLLSSFSSFSQNATLTNVVISPTNITVTYDLVSSNPVDIILCYSLDGKCTWDDAGAVTGDITCQTTGNGKTIVWDNIADGKKYGIFYFKLKTTPRLICNCMFAPEATVPAGQYVDVVVKVDASGNGTAAASPHTKTMRFLTYNLGANPALTPKEQMAYSSTGAGDPAVYGGLYQWGRKDSRHTFRCDPTPDADHDPKFTTGLIHITTLPESDNGKFVWGDLGSEVDANFGNWGGPHLDASPLWGNGGGLLTQNTTTYTASENTQNPCPTGYRVPTQHEWALLGWEDGSFTSDAYDFKSNLGTVVFTSANSDLVWVKVMNGVPSLTFTAGNLCGYALYKQSDWSAAIGVGGYFNGLLANGSNVSAVFSGKKLYDAGAPAPLLFLPTAGYRFYDDGVVYDVGTGGSYWSSTVGSDYSYALYFCSSFVQAGSYTGRAYGFSVRCVAE